MTSSPSERSSLAPRAARSSPPATGGRSANCGTCACSRRRPPGIVAHVAFSTPYVLLKPGLAEWQAYFRRVLPEAPQQARLDAYERYMKYGPTRRYWHDFVFEG